MTSEHPGSHRQPVPVITFTLPPSVLQRLLAEVPEEFRNAFATAALVEALDRHTSSCATNPDEVQGQIMSPTTTPAKKAGRPAPPIPKTKMSLYLDDQVWAALKASQRTNEDDSLSAATNRILRKALSLDD